MELESWVARRANEIDDETGCELSVAGTAPSPGDEGWLLAEPPETALALLVRHGIFPDPGQDFNLKSIPDIFHSPEFYTFWWCCRFRTPKTAAAAAIQANTNGKQGKARQCLWWLGKQRGRAQRRDQQQEDQSHVQLVFGGVNYRLDVYVNGTRLAAANRAVTEEGMFLRKMFDLTSVLQGPGKTNYIAVRVKPPDHVGCVDLGGQGGDHMIAKDVTSQFVEGWDWIEPVPDRNTGMWGPIGLQATGQVLLEDPHVTVSFADGSLNSNSLSNRTPDLSEAGVSLKVTCKNLSATSASSVTIRARMTRKGEKSDASVLQTTTWMKVITLAPQQTVSGVDLGMKTVQNPALWCPIGYGKQNLYDVSFSVHVSDQENPSHQVQVSFGFRHLQSSINTKTSSREFVINGVPVYIRGANYILPDAMLRCSKERCWAEVRYHAEMGLNMIRLWGGAAVPLHEFYEACDYYGILLWSEFWITGDCDGRGATKNSPESNPNWPLDHKLFLASAADVVKKLRHHPSIVLWCGGNEQMPCKDLDDGLRIMLGCSKSLRCTNKYSVVELDASRPYVSGSLWGGFGQGSGDFSDGPYGIQKESAFFSKDFYPYGFNPEVGSVGVPCAESMRSMFTSAAYQDPPKYTRKPDGTVVETVSPAWQFHKYITYGQELVSYGQPKGLEDFCLQAQIVNYTQYKALLEGWGSFMWSKYTGMLIWKSANPWIALRGQLYDWYLNPCGGFFAAKDVCGEAVHVQMNSSDNSLEVVSTFPGTIENARLAIETITLDNVRERKTMGPFSMGALQVTKLNQRIRAPDESTGVVFVKLDLVWSTGTSRNVFWLCPQASNFSSLQQWRTNKVQIIADIKTSTVSNGTWVTDLRLSNNTASVAFFVSLKVCKGESCNTCEDLVLPVHMTRNFVTIFPGETLNIQIECTPLSKQPFLLLEGWNVEKTFIPMKPNNQVYHNRRR